MRLDSPRALRSFLASLGVRPKRGLSQNFLVDGNILRKIVGTANIAKGDPVLEVGPGPGALTQSLLESGAEVTAVEKDPTFAKALERLQTPDHRLYIHEEDILSFSLEQCKKRGKVIANLPYHITTPILCRLIPHHERFSQLIVMVQEEVARRFTASPGTKEYGSITIFLSFYSTPRYLFRVSKHCFYPQPKVDSAVISLTLSPPPQDITPKAFFSLTRTAFQQRRKMLLSSLQKLFSRDKIEKTLLHLALPIRSRPEDLSFEQWLSLAKELSLPS